MRKSLTCRPQVADKSQFRHRGRWGEPMMQARARRHTAGVACAAAVATQGGNGRTCEGVVAGIHYAQLWKGASPRLWQRACRTAQKQATTGVSMHAARTAATRAGTPAVAPYHSDRSSTHPWTQKEAAESTWLARPGGAKLSSRRQRGRVWCG